jgi:hypothetical protein
MINLARPLHSFPILAKSAAIALVAAASLSFSAPYAHAGAAEVAALDTALTPSFQNATSQELYNAFVNVIGQTKFASKAGVVLGEAMRLAGSTDAGEFFANAILTDTNAAVVNARQNKNSLLALAAKTAATGKGLNVSQIPDLSAGLISSLIESERDAFATAAATASGSKPGAGAILGGRSSLLNDDTAKTSFANTSIQNKKLTSAAQDITRWIATTVGDTANYAVAVANANAKLTLAVATGAGFGDPTNAGNIVHALFNQPGLDDTTGAATLPPTVGPNADVLKALNAGAAKLATDISAGADIEEIQKIGNAFGQQIAKSSVKPGKGDIALSKAAGIVKSLVQAVINKPYTDAFGVTIDVNKELNKRDEAAEVAAYVLGGLIGSPELSFGIGDPKKAAAAANKAAATILALITNATSVKPKVVAKVAQGPTADLFAADVAASVALTVETSSLDPLIKTAVKNLLLGKDKNGNPTLKTATKINKIAATEIQTALNLVYAGNLLTTSGPNTGKPRFENGNSAVSAISDPETDSRPFSVI